MHRGFSQRYTEQKKKEEKKRRVTQEKVEMFKEEKRERRLRWKRLWHLKFLHGGAEIRGEKKKKKREDYAKVIRETGARGVEKK